MTLWQLTLEILFLQIIATQSEKINDPSLKPPQPFNAPSDADQLHSALEGKDWNKVIEIWFQRSHPQRITIKDIYKNKYQGETLEQRFEESPGGSLHDLFSVSFKSPQSLLGRTLHDTIAVNDGEEGVAEEIACANDPEMKAEMQVYYTQQYIRNFEEDIGIFCAANDEYKRVMVQYCWKGLCQEKRLTPEQADNEAKALRAINPDTDAEAFKKKLNELLDTKCEPDMKIIFQKYRDGGNGIEQATEKAYKNNKYAEDAYWQLVTYVEDTCLHYADELQSVVDGFGTDTNKINRIILTRCERDLQCILNKFKDMNGKTFTERLKTDTVCEPIYIDAIRYLCGKT